MRFLDLTLATIEENLALDEALLNEVEDGRQEAHLRVWELPRYAVVLGASCRIREDVIVDNCLSDEVPIARRSSGGGTVVIGPGALNFSIILPRDFAPGLDAVDQAQRFVLERVADELRVLGPAVEVLGSGDLTVGLRKVSGSAQRRMKRHFLVHASILYAFDLDRIGRYTLAPARQPSYREGRSHADFVTNLALSRDLLLGAIRAAWGPFEGTIGVDQIPTDSVRRLVAEKFAEPSWTSRL